MLEKTLESPLDCKEIQPVRSGLSFGPRSQASLQKAQGPGVYSIGPKRDPAGNLHRTVALEEGRLGRLSGAPRPRVGDGGNTARGRLRENGVERTRSPRHPHSPK